MFQRICVILDNHDNAGVHTVQVLWSLSNIKTIKLLFIVSDSSTMLSGMTMWEFVTMLQHNTGYVNMSDHNLVII